MDKYKLRGPSMGFIPSQLPAFKEYMTEKVIPTEITIPTPKAIETVYYVSPEMKEFEALKIKYPKIDSLAEGQHVDYFYSNPSQFIIDVHKAWSDLTTHEQKTGYLATIHNWILKNVDPNDYQYLFPKAAWNWVWWFICNVTPEHWEYGNSIYIHNDITGYIKDATQANQLITDETVKEEHRETTKTLLNKYAPAGFLDTLPEDLKRNFITTFFPGELAEIATAQVGKISASKFIGLGIIGIFGFYLISRIGRRRERTAKA